ncbi:MAG: hypothetical protein QM522_04640 [Chitinophagaceae bacterium]|nr:hypothetical protein [Chitinophagaceae bacterium]
MRTPALLVVLGSAALWLLASLLVGTAANRLPERWLQGRAQASGAPSWPRLGIRVWKRWIPDAGPALTGGVAKASLVRRDPAALQRLAVETRRAELVHWVLWPVWLLTLPWLPPAGVLANLLFACLFNLPCVLVQRHNRGRIAAILGRCRALRPPPPA